jgi:hypothetical protein
MTKLSSSELKDYICEAGIRYLPAEQIFYKSFPYKVELRPKHTGKGIGGVSGKRGCMIDVAKPEKARAELEAFNVRMELIISNVEYRQEIRDFVARLPKVEYKTRMGGDNNLFYFRDPDLVKVLVDRYKDAINTVTGPINAAHEDTIDKHNVLLRDKLYYNTFRYYIEFYGNKEFVNTLADGLVDVLDDMPADTWRQHHLKPIMSYHNTAHIRPHRSLPPRLVILYLSDPQDYVYLKLMLAEYVKSNHELVLFDDLDDNRTDSSEIDK